MGSRWQGRVGNRENNVSIGIVMVVLRVKDHGGISSKIVEFRVIERVKRGGDREVIVVSSRVAG
jgi:hypothetical protein